MFGNGDPSAGIGVMMTKMRMRTRGKTPMTSRTLIWKG